MLRVILFTALVVATAVPGAAEERTPTNIVVMLVDNIGYGDWGCYGNREIKTPHIDRLATQGARCTSFYIGAPSCMPSRGALLTGRHPLRNGLNEQIYKIDEHEQIGLPHREVILPELLREAGYVSGCFGKWNLGFAVGSRPTDRGFNKYFGSISGNCDYFTYVYNGRNDLYRNTEPATADGYSTFEFAEAACNFIEQNRSRPFFCYLAFTAAHFPNPKNKGPGMPAIWQAPASAFEAYGADPNTHDEQTRFQAVVTALDTGVGSVLGKIESLGLARQTLVVLLSDNGAFMIPGRGLECGSNRPLKGGGTTLWEGGIRVPCLVRWPDRIPAATVCDEPLWSMDLVPLALDAAGLEPTTVLDGKNPLPTLQSTASSPHRRLCWQWESSSAIRVGNYKLIRERKSRTREWQLFDLATDIGETHNLAAQQPEVFTSLQGEFEKWLEEVQEVP